MNLNEIKELIELVAEKGFAEFQVEHSGFKLKIVATASPVTHAAQPGAEAANTPLAATTAAAPSAVSTSPSRAVATLAPTAVSVEQTAADAGLHVVTSPIVGTFYRAPSPTADMFVKVGDRADVGTVLCIIEAMKLMNEIESDAAGEIVKIFVENGQPVEYGQPLFGIRP